MLFELNQEAGSGFWGFGCGGLGLRVQGFTRAWMVRGLGSKPNTLNPKKPGSRHKRP